MDLGLKNKVALVTGAGGQKGFGKTIAISLAREGCNVIVADINISGAKQTAAEIEALGGKALAVKADITRSAEVVEMVNAGLAKFGRIDILVNNAGGIFQKKLFADKTEEECDRDINLNLKGAMNCIRAVVKSMLDHKYGKIINITTIGAQKGVPGTTVYNASKAGIIGLSKSLAADLGPFGINVNCVAPGLGMTDFGGGDPPEDILKGSLARTPNRRTTTPQDIANAVVFLASDVSSDILGQNLAVDGGDSCV
jgi:3-oxoacyl-[acyl-carrier protein] reductase